MESDTNKQKQPEEEKIIKKKLVRVEGRQTNGNNYEFSSINFAFVSSPAHGRKQASSTMTCREHFNRTLWKAVRKVDDSYHTWNKDAPIDLEKLRILIVFDPKNTSVEKFREKLFNGKACLNVLEKINGWKPSSITTVKHSAYKNAWLLTGPGEWLSQPQLLSLATWVLRLAANHGPIASDNFDALEANLKKIAHSTQHSGNSSDSTSYVRAFWDKLYILLKYHKEIWEHMDFKKGWDIECPVDRTFGSASGLLTFVEGNADYSSDVKKASKKFKELCKKHLPRKES